MIEVADAGKLILYSCCNDECDDNSELFIYHDGNFIKYDVILNAFRKIIKNE